MKQQDDIRKEIEQALLAVAHEGRITCAEARRIAERLNVSYYEVGTVADRLKIKITNCELGCF